MTLNMEIRMTIETLYTEIWIYGDKDENDI